MPPGRATRDQAGADRVRRRRENDRHRPLLPALPRGRGGSERDNDIDLEPDELGRNLGVALIAPLGPAILNRDAATFGPAEFAQPLNKGGTRGLKRRRTQNPRTR